MTPQAATGPQGPAGPVGPAGPAEIVRGEYGFGGALVVVLEHERQSFQGARRRLGRTASRRAPAVKAVGLSHRSPYALRHSFAAWAIAAGIGLFELASLMGTSIERIDRTYGHLLPDSLDRPRAAPDAYFANGDAVTARRL